MSLIASEFDQASFLQKNGELNKSKKILEKILKLQPGHFDSIFLLSIINYQLSLFLDALKYNDLALELRSNFFQSYNNRAIILKKLKNYNEALISIDKAISLNPNFAEFYNNKANILGISESGFRCLTNNGNNGGQEVPHLHFHVFGGEELGKMINK